MIELRNSQKCHSQIKRAVCPQVGSQCLLLAETETSGHFEIVDTDPPIPIPAIKLDIKYWGTVSGNSVTEPGVSQLLFLSSSVDSPIRNILT